MIESLGMNLYISATICYYYGVESIFNHISRVLFGKLILKNFKF